MSVPGFFTHIREYQLPHPRISLRVVLVTHLALAKAFELLRNEPPTGFVLSSAKEDDITRQLHWILENRLLSTGEVPGFDRRRIANVIRAPEVTNHDGKHPAKKPDLVLFVLRRASFSIIASQDGIVAECKPVDAQHPIGKHYCDSGIGRFVNGDYAWAMQEGLMVAYVRGDRTIAADLAPVLASEIRHEGLGSPQPPKAVRSSYGSRDSQVLHETVHRRSFQWPSNLGSACQISLFHSWHNCS
jgi:hypothetical protein